MDDRSLALRECANLIINKHNLSGNHLDCFMNGIDEICEALEQGIMTDELLGVTQEITNIRKVAPATLQIIEAVEEFLR